MQSIEANGMTMLRAEVCNNNEYCEVHSRLKCQQFGWANRDEEVISGSLLSIAGVVEASCYDGYCISLKKAQLFSWDEILEKAMPVIAEHLGITQSD